MEKRNLAKTRRLLNADVESVNGRYIDGLNDTLLVRASRKGYRKIVDELLLHHADVNAKNEKSCTALMEASCKGHREIAIELISHNAGVDLKDLHGTTPLMAASTKGHYKIVEELINDNADVNCQDNKGNTALNLVLMENINDATMNIVELPLSDRTNLEKRNKKKKTAIQLAQESKKQDIIDMIEDFSDSRRVEAAKRELKKLEAIQIINKGKRELAREMIMNDEVLNLKEIIDDQMETANATLEERLERNREELTAKRYLLKKKSKMMIIKDIKNCRSRTSTLKNAMKERNLIM